MLSDDNRDEIIIPPEEVTAFLESLRQQRAEEEEWDEQSMEFLNNMQSALSDGKYYDAFVYAQKLHAHEYAKYMDEIEACYLCCAEHGEGEALAFLTERIIYRNDGRPSSEAFPNIRRLADMGYIRSFIWLAECYNWGIGCDIDREKAAKYFAESIIFGKNNRAKELYRSLNLETDYPVADRQYRDIIQIILHKRDCEAARTKFAELIMEEKIEEYCPASAYAVLMRGYNRSPHGNDGILLLHLAECFVNGIGVEADYVIALAILENAVFELELYLEYPDDYMQDDADKPLYEVKDYAVALENVKALITETEQRADKAGIPCELADDIDWREELEREEHKPRWIKRRHCELVAGTAN